MVLSYLMLYRIVKRFFSADTLFWFRGTACCRSDLVRRCAIRVCWREPVDSWPGREKVLGLGVTKETLVLREGGEKRESRAERFPQDGNAAAGYPPDYGGLFSQNEPPSVADIPPKKSRDVCAT